MRTVEVATSSIKLDQFLKWADLTDSGGQSKFIIKAGLVSVNGQVEYQRGRQLSHGDIVEIDGQEPVRLDAPPREL